MLNQVYISNFPELSEILPTDKIVLFKKRKDDLYEPIVVEASEISSFFIDKNYVETLEKQIEEMTELTAVLEKELARKFLTEREIADTYSTKSDIDSKIKRYKTVNDFSDDIKGKATKTYLNAKYVEVLEKLQHLKIRFSSYSDKGDYWGKDPKRYPYKTVLATLAKRVSKGLEDKKEE